MTWQTPVGLSYMINNSGTYVEISKYKYKSIDIVSRKIYTFIYIYVRVCVRACLNMVFTIPVYKNNGVLHSKPLITHPCFILTRTENIAPLSIILLLSIFNSFSSTSFVDSVVKSEFVQFYGILMASPVNNWKNNQLRNSPLYRKHIRRERITCICRPLARQMQWLEKRWQP